ncbi:MAG: AI-2E family transporter [Bacilli bacterium]|nr:AI-2E family transporter [Bacilli bacterium]
MKDSDMKKWIILILVAVLSFWVVNNFSVIFGVIGIVFSVLFPFILGGVIAFILNIPMSKIEKFLSKYIKGENKKGLIRVISIICSLLLFVGIIALIILLLVPELISNIELLISNIPEFVNNIETWMIDLMVRYPDAQVEIENFFASNGNVSEILTDVLNLAINGFVDFVSGFVSGFITFFTAIIFSIYMLSQKEYLARSVKKIMTAYLSKEHKDKVLEIGSLSNKTFSKFITGQCVEAIILGLIIFLVCLIFRFPYALIIAVLTSVTALIPIFGAIIAMCVGILLISITNPLQALIFGAVFLVVQQIEGNVIYPKVVGKSVGLSPMWTLLAISVGGSLFGVVGMFIGLPVASIVYALIRNQVNDDLKKKKIKEA